MQLILSETVRLQLKACMFRLLTRHAVDNKTYIGRVWWSHVTVTRRRCPQYRRTVRHLVASPTPLATLRQRPRYVRSAIHPQKKQVSIAVLPSRALQRQTQQNKHELA